MLYFPCTKGMSFLLPVLSERKVRFELVRVLPLAVVDERVAGQTGALRLRAGNADDEVRLRELAQPRIVRIEIGQLAAVQRLDELVDRLVHGRRALSSPSGRCPFEGACFISTASTMFVISSVRALPPSDA